MHNERAFIARLEAANTEELAQILANPTSDEEATLRLYLGDDRFRQLRGLTLKRNLGRGASNGRGNVVVLHGIMGSDLSSLSRNGAQERIWANPLRIITGQLERLRLNPDGMTEANPEFDVRPSGIMKRYYGALQLALSANWTVRAFWYDWRKDLKLAAADLEAQMVSWFGADAKVHLVAHSMGGLVARTFIGAYPERWKRMWDEQGDGRLGGRLIMLGTPNYGSFNIPQLISGVNQMMRMLAVADLRHDLNELRAIVNTFVGPYQMLPWPDVKAMAQMKALYTSESYGDVVKVPQRHLNAALEHYAFLRDVIDPKRMIYIAGCNRPTFSGIRDLKKLAMNDTPDNYGVTLDGDGTVPHILGLLDGVPAYYVEENHTDLTSNSQVLEALDELLQRGQTLTLAQKPPAVRGELQDANDEQLRQQLLTAQRNDEKRLGDILFRLRTRGTQPAETDYITADERMVEDLIVRGFRSNPTADPGAGPDVPFEPSTITIRLVLGSIIEIHNQPGGELPVDAIACGHYMRTVPYGSLKDLDRSISQALHLQQADGETEMPDNLLAEFAKHGTLRSELGQIFLLPDSRPSKRRKDVAPSRLIAIAGMGLPGRFGGPELAVLSRELCWALGRVGKKHMATVAIGAGRGGLSTQEVMSSWIRGIKHAVTGTTDDDQQRLKIITFVELNPRRLIDINNVIIHEQQLLAQQKRLVIDYTPLTPEQITQHTQQAGKWEYDQFMRQASALPGDTNDMQTTITIGFDERAYRFGALTRTAAIPEREIPLDPALVKVANDELVAETDRLMQRQRGAFLEKLLVPEDLRDQLYTDAPLVLMLDPTTARIHWEMIAQTEWTASVSSIRGDDTELNYLGTARGLTRQLRTVFAPPPEPPPAARRQLRVLVIADPASDAHLPGAEEEGIQVADLFDRFNIISERSGNPNRVEVVRLFGPREATRTNVLRNLMLQSYDAVHFAGHCVYDEKNPVASGWIFSNGERLTANEMRRIDRVPRFVFSNACESGITPDRSERRSDLLAPTFAEAFFMRGVANFVCTAWPVDDAAARRFALVLYASLLGLKPPPPKPPADGEPLGGVDDIASLVDSVWDRPTYYQATDPQPIYSAMRAARLAIFNIPNGVRTWGAYQHYGNPFYSFFDIQRKHHGDAEE